MARRMKALFRFAIHRKLFDDAAIFLHTVRLIKLDVNHFKWEVHLVELAPATVSVVIRLLYERIICTEFRAD